MKAVFLTMTLLATSAFLIATPAQAFDGTKNSGLATHSRGVAGPCPAGTCNQKGGPNANNVKLCSAENCKGKGRR
ncbi:MAG TPA: hypothetical protein VJL90_04415 [Pseudorhodoplanes sp.]|nr:hypothetical protein [Pseudorhodoplanes sp.]